MLTNPPFMRQKDTPPFHLRPWTAEELEQALRMRAAHEALHPQAPVAEPKAP